MMFDEPVSEDIITVIPPSVTLNEFAILFGSATRKANVAFKDVTMYQYNDGRVAILHKPELSKTKIVVMKK